MYKVYKAIDRFHIVAHKKEHIGDVSERINNICWFVRVAGVRILPDMKNI